MGPIKRPSILETNILYLLLGLSLLTLGSVVQNREIYSGLLITEYLIVLLPNLIFIGLRGLSFRETLKLRKISIKNIIMVIVITIFSYPVVVFVQAIFLGLISLFKDIQPTGVPVPMNDLQYLYSFLVIAVSPGICEEIMFRGTIMAAYDRLGPKKSIVITGLLFGIFHFTILNFIGPFLLGIIFGIMVYKTNSIYSAIIGHTVNNGIAISLLYFLNKYGDKIDGLSDQSQAVESIALGKGIFFILLLLILSTFIVVKLLKKLSGPTRTGSYVDYGIYEIYHNDPYEDQTPFIYKYLPILVSIVIFIYVNWKFILI